MKLSELQDLLNTLKHRGGTVDLRQDTQILEELGMEPGAIYQELEMDSRYVDTHRDTSWSNNTVNLHSHSFYEILYCRNSCGAEYLVGADRYRLQKGDIVLIAPGISHRPLLPDSLTEPYRRDVIWISPEFMEGILRAFPFIYLEQAGYTALLRADAAHQALLGDLFQIGVTEVETRAPGWEPAVIGNTIQILVQLYRIFSDQEAAPLKAEKPELLDRVLAYVETHLAEKITLEEISRLFFVSESTISQTFRKKMGVSFHRCVTQRRLIAAKALIAEGIALEVVGHQVGFADYSSFYRAFKQEYGISPRQYRKLQDNTESGV